MQIALRQYNSADDYRRISDFLIAHHRPGNLDGNRLEPAWEYMHFHPLLDSASLAKIGVWEEGGEIVAAAHYEWRLGEAFFQFHPAYRHLRKAMLDYAEANLAGISRVDGRRHLCAYINDNDSAFLALAQARGYAQEPEETRPLYRFDIPGSFPVIPLAVSGHRVQSSRCP